MPKRSGRLKAKRTEGGSDGDAGIERIGTVELRNCVIAAPIRRQAAQEPTPGAAAAAEPATACTHAPVSQTAVLKFEATDDLSCSINLGSVEAFKKKLGNKEEREPFIHALRRWMRTALTHEHEAGGTFLPNPESALYHAPDRGKTAMVRLKKVSDMRKMIASAEKAQRAPSTGAAPPLVFQMSLCAAPQNGLKALEDGEKASNGDDMLLKKGRAKKRAQAATVTTDGDALLGAVEPASKKPAGKEKQPAGVAASFGGAGPGSDGSGSEDDEEAEDHSGTLFVCIKGVVISSSDGKPISSTANEPLAQSKPIKLVVQDFLDALSKRDTAQALYDQLVEEAEEVYDGVAGADKPAVGAKLYISPKHKFGTMQLVSEPSDLANAIKPQEGTGGVIHIALTAQATDKKFVLLNKASDKNAVQLLGNDSKLCRERNSREKQEANRQAGRDGGADASALPQIAGILRRYVLRKYGLDFVGDASRMLALCFVDMHKDTSAAEVLTALKSSVAAAGGEQSLDSIKTPEGQELLGDETRGQIENYFQFPPSGGLAVEFPQRQDATGGGGGGGGSLGASGPSSDLTSAIKGLVDTLAQKHEPKPAALRDASNAVADSPTKLLARSQAFSDQAKTLRAAGKHELAQKCDTKAEDLINKALGSDSD